MMKKIRTIGGQPIFLEETDFTDWVTGVKRTMVEFVKRKDDGTRVRIPIMAAPPVMNNYTRKTAIFGGDETRRLKENEINRLFGEYRKVIEAA